MYFYISELKMQVQVYNFRLKSKMGPNAFHVYFAAVNVVSVGLLLSPHAEQSLSHMASCHRWLCSVTSGTGELLVL